MTAHVGSLEVRIPISPRPDYFNRVRLIAHSLRERYPDAVFQVSVGWEHAAYDLYAALPWSRQLGIEWAWVPPAEFARWSQTQHPYIATMMQRFKAPFNAEHVLMLDADVLAIRGFDELFAVENAVAGVMAHVSPFGDAHVETWRALFDGYGLGEPLFDQEQSGWTTMVMDPRLRYSPVYLNTGVVFARAEILQGLYAPYMDALAFVRSRMDTYYFEQIALTLAAKRTGITLEVVPLRFNFPNQPAFDRARPAEFEDLRLLHFLRTDTVHREHDFVDAHAIRQLIARTDLDGSNELLRARVAELAARYGITA